MLSIHIMHVPMELRDLAYFVACVEEVSVTRAARRCHVAQPTISHALARLEKSVGERLLVRLPRAGVRPTPAGRLLATRARESLRVRRDDPLAERRRLPVRALADRSVALVPPDSHTGQVIYAACVQAGFTPRVNITLDSGEALREAVRAGIGITVLPERYLPPHDHDLVSVPLHSPRPSREVLLLRPRATTAGAAAEAFVALLRSVRASTRALRSQARSVVRNPG